MYSEIELASYNAKEGIDYLLRFLSITDDFAVVLTVLIVFVFVIVDDLFIVVAVDPIDDDDVAGSLFIVVLLC